MKIENKKKWVELKKIEIPSHILEVGLNMLYIEPHDMLERLKSRKTIESIKLDDIYEINNDTCFIDISHIPYNEELDNIAYAKQLKPELAVIAKDIIIEEYQIFLSRIYQFDAIVFPIKLLEKKELEKFMSIINSLGMLPIPLIQNKNDTEKIPIELTKVIVIEKNMNYPKEKYIQFYIDEGGNLIKC